LYNGILGMRSSD